MRRSLVFAALAFASLVGCPDLSGLSTNFDASIDAPSDDASDAGVGDCGVARRIQSYHYNDTDPDGGGGIAVSINLVLAQARGDFIVATVNYDESLCGPPTVSDTNGNTYVKLVAADVNLGAGTLETWGAENVSAADLGKNTVTATFPSSCNGRAMKVVHYTGIATSAAVESTTSEHGDAASATQLLTVTSPALLFAHTADQHVAYEAGLGWSFVLIDDWATIAEDRDALEAGSYLVDYVHSAENWVIQGVALRRCQ